jgi:hypothetical protein
LQKLSKTAHQFANENCEKTKMHFYRNTSAHKFKIVDKVLFSNVFSTGKNPKLVPNYKGPAKIIDINDTNAKIKIVNKIKVINMQKLKLLLEEEDSEKDTHFEDLNFNENQFDGPITRTRAKLQKCCTTGIVHFKKNKEETEIEINIQAMSFIPNEQCLICDWRTKLMPRTHCYATSSNQTFGSRQKSWMPSRKKFHGSPP